MPPPSPCALIEDASERIAIGRTACRNLATCAFMSTPSSEAGAITARLWPDMIEVWVKVHGFLERTPQPRVREPELARVEWRAPDSTLAPLRRWWDTNATCAYRM